MTRPRHIQVAWVIATWFGCGMSPVAPGTVGSLAALPLYYAVRGLGAGAVAAAAMAIAALGVWAGGVVARTSGRKDPQIVVVDEVAGVLLTLAVAPTSPAAVVAGVLLFRLFDVTKPFPARAAERLPDGWGIMLDDLVAAAWAGAVVLTAGALGVRP